MRVDGVDPIQLNKVYDSTQKPVVQESLRQDPRQKQQDSVLGREQVVVEEDRRNVDVLEDAIKKINQAAQIFDRSLHFRVHEATERLIVQVINRENGEVIREIPPERVLNMVAQIQSVIGLFVDYRR